MRQIFMAYILIFGGLIITSSTYFSPKNEAVYIVGEPLATASPTATYEFVGGHHTIESYVITEERVYVNDIYEPATTQVEVISDEEIELIALVTMAEAEGECEEGKRLVIDTILNRVDSENFPDSIFDVIYQPAQFSSMWNGRIKRCEVLEEICDLVREELESRTNYETIFFSSKGYRYGEPLFKVENHYFSSEN
ncbi:hypothetical protein FACS189490_11300 [Clostridia bacterium]|nr:hypothetical protein FACS189490_11300 [Clostridia bacterium]